MRLLTKLQYMYLYENESLVKEIKWMQTKIFANDVFAIFYYYGI